MVNVLTSEMVLDLPSLVFSTYLWIFRCSLTSIYYRGSYRNLFCGVVVLCLNST